MGIANITDNILTDSGVSVSSFPSGSGTANEIAYWVSSSSVGSLTTVTYPSLTELSYVKGVTSSIQTQFSGKQNTLTLTTTGTSGAATLTGDTLNIPQYSGGGGSMAIGGSITSATAGSVLFAGVGGILQQDNANFFWDDTNNRLGIGTNSPTGQIHINSDLTASSNKYLTITRTGVSLADANFQIGNATNVASQFLGELVFTSNYAELGSLPLNYGGYIIARITNSQINDVGLIFRSETKSLTALTQGWIASFRNNLTDYVRIAHNGNMVLQNGGTFTDAGFRLDVNGTARIQGNLTTNTTAGSVLFAGTSGLLSQDNSTFFWDNTNKRLGIGTSTTSAKLEILNTTDGIHTFKVRASGAPLPSFSIEDGDITIPNYSGTGANPPIGTNEIGRLGALGSTIGGLQILAYSNNTDERAMFLTATSGRTTATANAVMTFRSQKHNGTTSVTDLAGGDIAFAWNNGATKIAQMWGNGNLLLQNGGTFTDAGYRLDVNGTARVSGLITAAAGVSYTRLNPITTTVASTATLTPDISVGDTFTITAQAVALSVANPTGTPVNGQKMIIRIKDNGTARAITFSGTQYRASSDLAFPTTTIINKTMYLGFIWNSTDSKWDLLAFLNNF